VASEHAPGAWVRQGGSNLPLSKRLATPKALVLDSLSSQFRKRAAGANIAFNTAFAGAYDFTRPSDFGALMQGFLRGLPDGGLVMCHPGFVDETLVALDPLTHQREQEHAFLAGDQFEPLLAANKVTLS
jgi:chitin disaccharide deacetylase